MITTETSRNVIVGGDFDAKQFSVKVNSKAFRTLVSNLYSDKVRAVMTELSANAYDSHIAAGKQSVPFRVEMPTEFDPTFRIRDYGTGISHDFMMNRYTVAFESSKDTSNAYNGEKGLGRLSVLALCDSYLCTSYFQGQKNIYSIFYNNDGVPCISFLGGEPTNEQDGFMIEIPVKSSDIQRFITVYPEVYQYYTIKPEILNVDGINFPEDEYIFSCPNRSWGVKRNIGPSKAICSVYAYPITPDSISGLSEKERMLLEHGVDIRFDIGEVHSSANRESLDYNEKTLQSLRAKISEVAKELHKSVDVQFQSKKTFEKLVLSNSVFGYSGSLSSLKGMFQNDYSKFDFSTLEKISFQEAGFKTVYRRYAYYSSQKFYMAPTYPMQFFQNSLEQYTFVYVDKKAFLKNKIKSLCNKLKEEGRSPKVITIETTNGSGEQALRDFGFDLDGMIKASNLPKDVSSSRSVRSKDNFYFLEEDKGRVKTDWYISPLQDKTIFWVRRNVFCLQDNRFSFTYGGKNYFIEMSIVQRVLDKNLGKDKYAIIGLSSSEQEKYGEDFDSLGDAFGDYLTDYLNEKTEDFKLCQNLNLTTTQELFLGSHEFRTFCDKSDIKECKELMELNNRKKSLFQGNHFFYSLCSEIKFPDDAKKKEYQDLIDKVFKYTSLGIQFFNSSKLDFSKPELCEKVKALFDN